MTSYPTPARANPSFVGSRGARLSSRSGGVGIGGVFPVPVDFRDRYPAPAPEQFNENFRTANDVIFYQATEEETESMIQEFTSV